MWRQWSGTTQLTIAAMQPPQNVNSSRQCYNCRKLGHLAKKCRVRSTESKVQSQNAVENSVKNSINRQVDGMYVPNFHVH